MSAPPLRPRRGVGGVLVDTGPLRQHAGFRRLRTGQVVASMGSQLTAVAVGYQTYKLTGSTAVVGLVSLGQLVPLLAGAVLGGPVVDAWDRRKVMLVTQVLLAAGCAGLAVNATLGQEPPEMACAGAWLAVLPGTVLPGTVEVPPSSLPPSSPDCPVPAEGVVAGVAAVPLDAVWAEPGRLTATTPAVASEATPAVTVSRRIRSRPRSRCLTTEARSWRLFTGPHLSPRASRRSCGRGRPRRRGGRAGRAR